MYPFLKLVAGDLIARFGTNLAETVVVFPSQRARLFLNTYLYQEAQKPLWAPQYLSIEELFEKNSLLRKADSVQLIGELYEAYTTVFNAHSEIPMHETLDEFFYFGEILLNDFDEVDKNLVDAGLLFHNLKDLDDLKDDFSHLTENQRKALMRFGKLFDQSSPLKDSFLSVWNILGEVYTKFGSRLREQGIAYPGMLMRDALEKENSGFPAENYIFVGFNVLNKCEEKLFRNLKTKSLFYWDYDNYYLEQEAGKFIKRNITLFGSALENQDTDSFLSVPKEINIISSPSESGQAGMIIPWIDSLNKKPDFSQPDSAVVLCNESVLPAVIHAIPSDRVENVNITMGFPLSQTPVAGFLQVLTDLQAKGIANQGRNFHYKQVLAVLRHPYCRNIFQGTEEIEKEIVRNNIFFPDKQVLKNLPIFEFTSNTVELTEYLLEQIRLLGDSYNRRNSGDVYDGLYQESIFQVYQLVNRLYGLLLSGEWNLEKLTFIRLLKKLIAAAKVPFHGEPVKGLQVMGVLETRTLDFRNVLMMSVNEGFMPGSENDNTFIPQFLRQHFDLRTFEYQDSIYSYYFYRLLQRAEKITLVYNAGKSGFGKAEMSRFLLQLLVEDRLNVNRISLQSSAIPLKTAPVIIYKTEEIIHSIKEKFDLNTNPEAKSLTPSTLNVFIDCSLRFYLQKIKGYETEEELSEEVDSSVFGTIFHHAAEYLYREIGRVGEQKAFHPFEVKKEHLEFYRLPENDYRIRKFVSKAFDRDYFKRKPVDESQYNGEQLINFQVICEMLKRLILFDMKNTPFTVLGLEWKEYDFIEFPESNVNLKIGGIIDRLEEKNGFVRIIDYKTGGKTKAFRLLADLFQAKDNRAAHIFQTFVYASVLTHKRANSVPVTPSLLYMTEIAKDNFTPFISYEEVSVEDFRTLVMDFDELLLKKLNELFDENIPFTQTPVTINCTYCDFKEMCNR